MSLQRLGFLVVFDVEFFVTNVFVPQNMQESVSINHIISACSVSVVNNENSRNNCSDYKLTRGLLSS